MAITYKDISQLSQKASVAGTEKLPVSKTEYITPAQIIKPVKDVTDYLLENMSLDELTRYKRQINSSGEWASYTSSDPDSCVLLPITPGEKYQITGSGSAVGYFAILAESSPKSSGSASFATGYSSRLAMSSNDNFYEFVAPSNAASIYLLLVNHSGATYDFVVYHLKALASYEQASNKVTSMSASSTDEQYPSAKCVYDAIPSVSGLVSKSGDEMESDAELVFPHYGNEDLLLSTTINVDGVTVIDTDEEAGAWLTIDGLYVASDHLDGKQTLYARGEIHNSNSAGNTTYTLTLPEATGTVALTSDIPNITISSSEPTSGDGSNGDIWIVI